MAKEVIETSKEPYIEVVECAGDLVVRSWMEAAVRAKGDCHFENKEEGLQFYSSSDLRLDVPEGASLKIGTVAGDLVVKNISGEFSLLEVQGDTVLANMGSAKIANVRGDLSAKNLAGPLGVETIDGDVALRNIANEVFFRQVNGDFAASFVTGAIYLQQIEGDISLRTVNGDIEINTGHRDVNLRNLGGCCTVEKIHGDIRLLGGLAVGNHSFSAEGDIVVRWPTTSPLELVAKAPEIRNKLPLQGVKKIDDGLIGRLGDGDTIVNLTAGGRILLKEAQMIDEKWKTGPQETFEMDFMSDLANIGERVSAEVNQHMARMTNQMEAYFGPEFAQNISEKVAQQADRAARQAEKAAEKARKYAEREAARAERRYQRSSGMTPPRTPTQPQEIGKHASSEEQLKILKMVEKGTISPDEANTLLEALEG